MRRCLALLLLGAACTDRPVGEDTDATSTSTTSTTSTSTSTSTDAPTTSTPTTSDGSSTTDAIEPYLEFQYDGDPQTWMLTCGTPELCPGEKPLVFTVDSPDLFNPNTVEVSDLERARCMATALRDQTFGQFAWMIVADSTVVTEPSVEVLKDVAIARSVGPSQGPAPTVYEGIYALREPEFFAACAEGDAMAVYACLLDSVLPDCLPGPLSCPK